MARTHGPSLSLSLSGSIGKVLTFQDRPGASVAYLHTTPRDPKSAAQLAQRELMTWLNTVWSPGQTDLTEAWLPLALAKKVPGRQLFVGRNLTTLKGATTLANLRVCSQILAGPAPASLAIANVGHNLRATLTIPTVPAAWSYSQGRFLWFKEGDPHTKAPALINQNNNAGNPAVVTRTGLVVGVLYRCFGFIRWRYQDAPFSYSIALTATGTPV